MNVSVRSVIPVILGTHSLRIREDYCIYLPKPSNVAKDKTQGKFLCFVNMVRIQFSIFLSCFLNKGREPSLTYYLLIAGLAWFALFS